MSTRKKQLVRGFTLTEMLVVMGIIAVLVAVLFPIVVAARESGNRTVCSANLRSLGQSMTMYAQANRNCLPNDPKNDGKWYDFDRGNIVLVNLNDRYIRTPKVFFCPSDPNPPPKLITVGELDQPNSARTSYDFYSLYWPLTIAPIITRMHSQAPLAWDIDGGVVFGSSPYRNHKARAGNVVYADTHVEWVLASAPWDDTNRPPNFNKYYPPGP